MATSPEKPGVKVESKVPDNSSDAIAETDQADRKESQFTIRHVLACFFIVAVCLAPLQAGFAALMFISVPGVILGIDLVLRGRVWRPQSKTTVGKWLLSGSVAVGVILGLCACLKNGMPATTSTWCLLVGCVLWCVVAATKLDARVALFAVFVPLALQLHLVTKILPVHPQALVDVRRYREDYTPFPAVMFAQPTKSTAIISRYLGPAESHWVRNDQLGVFKYSILADDDLEKYLTVLPSDNARRQVLSALTDDKNILRHHQELALITIRAIGYPRNEDPAAWWEKYSYVFRVYHDAHDAVVVARGWREEMEKRLLGQIRYTGLRDPTLDIGIMPFKKVAAVEWMREFSAAASQNPLWDKPLEPGEKTLYWPNVPRAGHNIREKIHSRKTIN